MTAKLTTDKSIMPLPTVLATAVPARKAATKLKNAAQITALPGESTRVETTVAIELAASCKPLMKSKTSAVRNSAATSGSSGTLSVLDHDAFENVGDVFASIRRVLEEIQRLLP